MRHLIQSAQIDVIIPCYKAVNTLLRALASVYMQSIRDSIHVYIVNDADSCVYSSIIDKLDMDITYLETHINGGAGLARQYGIDNSNSPYIMFLDADDCLASAFACELLIYEAEKNNCDLVCSAFENDVRTNERLYISETELSTTWLHGKLYRREFLDKHNIRFNKDLRTNEDVYFNQLVLSYSPKTYSVKKICYSWITTKGSITRSNNRYDILYGYIEAVEAYALEALKRGLLDNKFVIQRIADGLLFNYWHYIELLNNYDQEHCMSFLSRCKEYYHNTLELIPEALNNEMLVSRYQQIIKSPEIARMIPTITMADYISSIRE